MNRNILLKNPYNEKHTTSYLLCWIGPWLLMPSLLPLVHRRPDAKIIVDGQN